jgi:hypothetical protein
MASVVRVFVTIFLLLCEILGGAQVAASIRLHAGKEKNVHAD